MKLDLSDIQDFKLYNQATNTTLQMVQKANSKPKPQKSQRQKSHLSHKLIAAWLKYDPFVNLVAKENDQIRHDAMLALAGQKAANQFFHKSSRLKPPPKLVYPGDVRKKEQEFFDKPSKRNKIIRELVFWGRDEYINKENPDSHNTRTQIASSLLGPLFLNSNEAQEKLIIQGLKVLVISRPTSLGVQGEQSPVVHKEIISRIGNILRYNQIVIEGKLKNHTEAAIKVNLIKTIQSLNKSRSRSAYYVADDQKLRKKIIAQKFPLKDNTYKGLVKILNHYTISGFSEARIQAKSIIKDLNID